MTVSVVEYEMSSRGHPVLITGGYRYQKNKETPKSTTYRCTGYYKYKCTAAIAKGKEFEDEPIVFLRPTHTHPPQVIPPEISTVLEETEEL
jgi:hypothetical protein